ncbi:HAD family hydrolase [Candidatus Bathyarchaeota archaeon]|nr:HAD family hydrolase [Candidatus Bathyarchaeota archaeon]MBS7629262.1 HAD family hydrolase [Candidatus Bathyarchaeota archaeon]
MVGGLLYKAVLFDLGGTLIAMEVDDKAVDERALRSLTGQIRSLGYCVSEEALIRDYWNHYEFLNTLRESLMVEFPMRFWLASFIYKLFGEVNDELLNIFEASIIDARVRSATLYHDTLPTLEGLEGRYRLGAVTNTSSTEVTRRILRRLRMDRFFEVTVTSADFGVRKPYPGIFHYALREMSLKPEDALFVGDSIKHDVAGSKQVGMKCYVISRGGVEGQPSEPKPNKILKNLEDILNLL